jgi:hypothetical protein
LGARVEDGSYEGSYMMGPGLLVSLDNDDGDDDIFVDHFNGTLI